MSSLSQHLAHAVMRAAERPEFLAHVFSRYCTAEHIDRAELAERLGCEGHAFMRLALCKVPAQPSSDDFRQLAYFSGADLGVLAHVMRRVQALDAITAGAEAQDRSALLAAREREEDERD